VSSTGAPVLVVRVAVLKSSLGASCRQHGTHNTLRALWKVSQDDLMDRDSAGCWCMFMGGGGYKPCSKFHLMVFKTIKHGMHKLGHPGLRLLHKLVVSATRETLVFQLGKWLLSLEC